MKTRPNYERTHRLRAQPCAKCAMPKRSAGMPLGWPFPDPHPPTSRRFAVSFRSPFPASRSLFPNFRLFDLSTFRFFASSLLPNPQSSISNRQSRRVLHSAPNSQGHDIVATTTTPSHIDELRQLGLTPALLNIANVDQLRDLLADREAVYLTIARSRRGVDYRDVYLAAAQSLASAATGTPVKRIIYTGSTRIYGQDDGSWVDESSPTEPKDENGRTLLQTEGTLLQDLPNSREDPLLTSPLDKGGTRGVLPGATTPRAVPMPKQRQPPPVTVTILRLGGIYGPDRDYRRRIRGLAGTTRTDADLYVNLIHLDDIVQALMALLSVPYHGVLNLVDDSPEQRGTMYDRVLNEANLRPIQWRKDEETTGLGKRVHNDLIKRTLDITLMHPTH